MSSNVNKLIFWLVIACLVIILYTVVKPGNKKVEQPLTFSQFLTAVEAGKIKTVQITANEVKGTFVDEAEGTLKTLIPSNYPDVYKMLRDKNVNVEIKEASNANLISLIINSIPFILLLALYFFIIVPANAAMARFKKPENETAAPVLTDEAKLLIEIRDMMKSGQSLR